MIREDEFHATRVKRGQDTYDERTLEDYRFRYGLDKDLMKKSYKRYKDEFVRKNAMSLSEYLNEIVPMMIEQYRNLTGEDIGEHTETSDFSDYAENKGGYMCAEERLF